jgi:hypothetical protein
MMLSCGYDHAGGSTGLRPSQRPLENEIGARHEVGAGDQDLHVGGRIAVHIGVDDHVSTVVRVAKLAGHAGECGAAYEGEGLVAGDERVGVDRREIDQVGAVAEAANDGVAERRSGWTFGNEVEIENVVACAAVESIPTGAADQYVVATPPVSVSLPVPPVM